MDYYDAIAEGYDELHSEEQAGKFGLIMKHLEINHNTLVLDVGCGTGLSASHFQGKIIGLDTARKLLEVAAARLHQVVLGRGEEMPFRNEAFDYVFAVTAIHNFEDPQAGLREIKRLGKKAVVISVLKKANKFDMISRTLEAEFKTWKSRKIIDEAHDLIFIIWRQ